MLRSTLLTAALALVLTGCDSGQSQAPPAVAPSASNTTSTPTSPTNTDPAATPSGTPVPEPSATQKKTLPAFANATNALAGDMYQLLQKEPGNLAMSPASISAALAMTWAGAAGDTEKEMAKVLHFSGDREAFIDAAGYALRSYNDTTRTDYTLRVANRLFGEKTYTFEAPFLELTKTTFDAPLERLDFQNAPGSQRDHINDWVEKQTEDRIQDLLPADAINSDTRLVLVNAIYMLAEWAQAFKKEATFDEDFFVDGTKPIKVPTMHQMDTFRYGETPEARLLEMPYKGSDLSMVIALPHTKDGLAEVEKSFTGERFNDWVGTLTSERVNVSLPKFTIDPSSPMMLADTLKKLGMTLAFDRSRADFTRMADPPTPDDRLVIAKVIHKAFVKVDEKGTEAAAATAVVMERAGSAMPIEQPKEFKADHPFLFFVRDMKTGAILFMGRLAKPE